MIYGKGTQTICGGKRMVELIESVMGNDSGDVGDGVAKV